MKIELLHFALKVNTCMPQHLYATYCEMFGQRTNNIFFFGLTAELLLFFLLGE